MPDWDQLVKECGPLVYGAAWRILGHAADTEDVVQDVFLEALRVRPGVVRSWPAVLYKLATCRALDRLRRRRPVVPLDGLALAAHDPDPEAAAVGHELADRLRAALGHLPPREATVFSLRYFEDLPNQRIAEILDLNPGAVAVALHKARSRLEGLLADAPCETSHAPRSPAPQ